MSEFSRITDTGDDRGLCKGCRWWQAEENCPGSGCPEGADHAIGLCMQPELTHFSMQVSGHSGCNRFEAKAAAHADRLAAGAASR
jgi:hypothetical protein